MSNDLIIDKLRTDSCNSVIDDIRYKNTFRHDKDFRYKVNKKESEVTITYKNDITFTFELPIYKVKLIPALSYIFFFRKNYTFKIIDSFKLEYKLAMHYVIALQNYIKILKNQR